MIGFTARVTYGSGPDADAVYEGEVTANVLLSFERKWKESVVKLIGDSMLFEPLLWLGWEAIKQAGVTVKPFESWVADNNPQVELVSPTPLAETPPPD